jgi:phosphatidylglycerol:prolipoprotein diacylglycerol transferase
MQQTLLVIPHDWINGPLFWGWLVVGFVWLIVVLVRQGVPEALGFVPFYLVVALMIRLVLPVLEIDGINPADPLGPPVKSGLAVRGYGVCLLMGILAGVGISMRRATATGLSAELILKLAMWMIVAGIVGARLFYVIQYRNEFSWGGPPWQLLLNLADATKGGLVVFGSLIFGSIAGALFFRLHRLPMLRTADLIAPGMALGLAIGRIGCLLNGCCYGAICEVDGVAKMSFPPGSPPYMHQMANGELIGLRTLEIAPRPDSYPLVVTQVIPGSIAAENGLRVSDKVAIRPMSESLVRFFKQRPSFQVGATPESTDDPQTTALQVFVFTDRSDFSVSVDQLPSRSIAVYPVQVYSAVDALLLSLLLWFFWYVRKGDGQVFALMMVLHGISRFLLEIIRTDEVGAFGTLLTISQWISIGLIVFGIVLFGWIGLGTRPSPRTGPATV